MNDRASECKEDSARKYEVQRCYNKKSKLLSYLNPSYIHVKHVGHENGKRVYRTDENFYDKLAKALCNGRICEPADGKHSNDYFYTIDFDKPKFQYYLYYEYNYHYHYFPIRQDEVEFYKKKYKLSVIQIEGHWRGNCPDEEVDMEFVDILIDVLESGRYELEEAVLLDDLFVDYNTGSFVDQDEVYKMQSDNIEYGLNYWAGELWEKVEERFKDSIVDLETASKEQEKELKRIEEEYAQELEDYVKSLVGNYKSLISTYRKTLVGIKHGTTKKKKGKITKIKKKLQTVGTIPYEPHFSRNEQVDFWDYMFCGCFDIDEPYCSFGGIESVEELEEHYKEWYDTYSGSGNCEVIENVRRNYFNIHVKELKSKYFGNLVEEARALLKEYEAL